MCNCRGKVDVKVKKGEYEVLADGNTVWVNGPGGGCIARFGRGGIDIHHTVQKQMEFGEQCLQCTHTRPTVHDWTLFQAGMMRHYGICIPEQHKPVWL